MDEKENLEYSLKAIAKTSSFVFFFLVLSKISAYLYRMIIARYFGPEIYGLLSLSIIVVGWFTSIFFFGLGEGFLRYSSYYRGKNEQSKIKYIFKFSVKILLLSGIFSFLLMFFSSGFISSNFFHNSNLVIFLRWFSVMVPFSLFSYFFINVLSSFEHVSSASFIQNILQTGSTLIILVILMFIGFGEKSIIFSNLAAFIIMTVVSVILCRIKFPVLFEKNDIEYKKKKEVKKEFLLYSLFYMLLTLVYSLFGGIDSFFLGYFKGASDVGVYNSAVPIVAFLLLSTGVMSLFFPLITKEYARKNFNLIGQLSRQVTKWIFIIDLPMLILILLFPGAVLNILFGSDYLGASTALRFLALGTFFSALFTVPLNILFMLGKIRLVFFDMVITVLVDILLNIILIPRFGLAGAGFSTMFCYLLSGMIFMFQVKKYLGIYPFRRKILRILLISLVPTFILLYSRIFITINIQSIILMCLFFMLLYFSLIFITRCLDENDIMILSSIKKKISRNFKNQN